MRKPRSIALWPFLIASLGACSQAYDVSKASTQTLTEVPGPDGPGGGGTTLVSDRFSVAPESKPLDILFVIDNSGSMKEEQDNLALSFDRFITDMQSNDLDFQIGVISTDPTRPNSATPLGSVPWTSSDYEDFQNLGAGSLLAYRGNEKVLKRSSSNLASQFMNNVTLGAGGDATGYEMGVQSLIYAFSPELSGPGKWNASLFRADALLSIIIVSDEDETRSFADRNKYLTQYPAEKELRLASFESAALALKANRRGLIRVDAIVSDPENPCETSHRTGTTYPELAHGFGGEVFSICEDFSDILSTLGSSITSQVMSTFALKKKALSIQSVKLNGGNLVVGRDYNFNSATNSITLIGDALAVVRTTRSTLDISYLVQ